MDESNRGQELSKRNVKNIGHEINERITDDAVLRVISEHEEDMKRDFRLAKMLASHAGRKTIKEQDVRLVYQFKGELE